MSAPLAPDTAARSRDHDFRPLHACWESLTRGDAESFRREASISAELWSFGLCACLLDERAAAGGQAPGSAERLGL